METLIGPRAVGQGTAARDTSTAARQPALPPGRILCATDFSGNASRAFQTSVRVARSCGAALRVLHVSPWDRASRVVALESQTDLDQRLERFSRSEEVADLAVSHRLRQGEPGVEIVRASLDEASDLIVIGRHSTVASAGWLLGSVTETVVRTAPCPVLVGEPGTPFRGPRARHVLCAVDLAETAAGTLAYSAGIAQALRADLLVLHVASATELVPAGRGSSPLLDQRPVAASDPVAALAKLCGDGASGRPGAQAGGHRRGVWSHRRAGA